MANEMAVFLRWYGRHTDMSIDYDDEHHGTVLGKSADDCMRQIRELKDNHDLSKFTPMQIELIYDC